MVSDKSSFSSLTANISLIYSGKTTKHINKYNPPQLKVHGKDFDQDGMKCAENTKEFQFSSPELLILSCTLVLVTFFPSRTVRGCNYLFPSL